MKFKCVKLINTSLTLAGYVLLHPHVQAQGTAFTYQGQLTAAGTPANGSFDVVFSLFATNTDGTAIAGPVTNSAVAVTNGLFTTTVDFGNIFTGGSNWLELAVSTSGDNNFFTLAPRQQLTPVPYAITAERLATPLDASSLPAEVVTNNAVDLNLTGTFAGDGSGLSGVDASLLGGLTSANFWQVGGNAGANPTNGAFLGTSDNFPLELRVNGVRAWRAEPGSDCANIIGGNAGNFIFPGTTGAFIGGGGSSLYGQTNVIGVAGNYAAILGGLNNTANAGCATVMGYGSRASGNVSTAIGCQATASGAYSFSAGYTTTAANMFATAMGYGTTANGVYSYSGGFSNIASGTSAFVGGGGNDDQDHTGFIGSHFNKATGGASAVVGGYGNVASGIDSSIGGGFGNTSANIYTAVAGGGINTASGYAAVVGGGYQNKAQGSYSTVPGGNYSLANGYGSFAAGCYAYSQNDGSFVWSDSTGSIINGFGSVKANQFLIRATGGVGIGTANTPPGGLNVASGGLAVTGSSSPNYPGATGVFVESAGTLGAVYAYDYVNGHTLPLCLNSPGGYVGINTLSPDAALTVNGYADKPGGGSWSTYSDARLKDVGGNFTPSLAALAKIQPVHYHYKSDNALKLPSQPAYIGVVAQQLQQAVPDAVQTNSSGYLTVNNDPVLWATVNAVKELNQKLETENAELKARLEKLEQLVLKHE